MCVVAKPMFVFALKDGGDPPAVSESVFHISLHYRRPVRSTLLILRRSERSFLPNEGGVMFDAVVEDGCCKWATMWEGLDSLQKQGRISLSLHRLSNCLVWLSHEMLHGVVEVLISRGAEEKDVWEGLEKEEAAANAAEEKAARAERKKTGCDGVPKPVAKRRRVLPAIEGGLAEEAEEAAEEEEAGSEHSAHSDSERESEARYRLLASHRIIDTLSCRQPERLLERLLAASS